MEHYKQMYNFLCAQQVMERYLVSMEPSPTATLKAYQKKLRFANLLALIFLLKHNYTQRLPCHTIYRWSTTYQHKKWLSLDMKKQMINFKRIKMK